jgi:hypothetical protein
MFLFAPAISLTAENSIENNSASKIDNTFSLETVLFGEYNFSGSFIIDGCAVSYDITVIVDDETNKPTSGSGEVSFSGSGCEELDGTTFNYSFGIQTNSEGQITEITPIGDAHPIFYQENFQANFIDSLNSQL